MTTRVALGDRVRVQCLAMLKDGTVLDRGRQVLDFTVGSDEVLPGIDMGVLDMAEGDEKRLTLAPEQAFGPVRPKLTRAIPRARFPAHLTLRVGQRWTGKGVVSGRRRQVEVVQINPETVVVDGNHPLAGQTLEIELQLISVETSPPRSAGR